MRSLIVCTRCGHSWRRIPDEGGNSLRLTNEGACPRGGSLSVRRSSSVPGEARRDGTTSRSQHSTQCSSLLPEYRCGQRDRRAKSTLGPIVQPQRRKCATIFRAVGVMMVEALVLYCVPCGGASNRHPCQGLDWLPAHVDVSSNPILNRFCADIERGLYLAAPLSDEPNLRIERPGEFLEERTPAARARPQ